MQHNEMLRAAVAGKANSILPASVSMAEVMPVLYEPEVGTSVFPSFLLPF